MTDNLAAPVPEKCCFCFYQPGGHLMAKSHYALSLIALIIGIVVGVDDKRSVHFDFFFVGKFNFFICKLNFADHSPNSIQLRRVTTRV